MLLWFMCCCCCCCCAVLVKPPRVARNDGPGVDDRDPIMSRVAAGGDRTGGLNELREGTGVSITGASLLAQCDFADSFVRGESSGCVWGSRGTERAPLLACACCSGAASSRAGQPGLAPNAGAGGGGGDMRPERCRLTVLNLLSRFSAGIDSMAGQATLTEFP